MPRDAGGQAGEHPLNQPAKQQDRLCSGSFPGEENSMAAFVTAHGYGNCRDFLTCQNIQYF